MLSGNVLLPMEVTLSGNVTDVRPVSWNATAPMVLRPHRNSTDARFVHRENAQTLIEETLPGIVTDVRLVHPEKQLWLMEVRPSGIVIDVRLLQPLNAYW